MANRRKGKASKRKLDMREESGKLARQIGDRIQELRERIKDGDGRPITQPAFYDFIFDKPEYQQSTDDPNEPKPEESKQTEISNIEGGKDMNLSLLCLISDKCGVSLDYLIRGKEYQPSAPTCPPEGKGASPTGDNPQPEKEPSAEMGSTNLPPEEKAENGPYAEYLSCSPYDICKALVALSFIADLRISELKSTQGRLGQTGYRLDTWPKEIVIPISQSENRFELVNNLPGSNLNPTSELLKRGLCSPRPFPLFNFKLSNINEKDIPAHISALHFIDKRITGIFNFIEWNSLNLEGFTFIDNDRQYVHMPSQDKIHIALNYGINYHDYLNTSKMINYGNTIAILQEPFITFINRARKEKFDYK